MFSNHQNVRNITKYHLYHKTKKNWAGDFKSSLERSQYPSNFPIKPSDFSDQMMELEMVLILQWLFICCWLWIHWIHPKKSCFGFFSKNLLFTIIQIHDLSDSNIYSRSVGCLPTLFDLLPQAGALQSKVSRAKEEIMSDSNSHSKSHG
jgi:hypothetical protein